MTTRHDCHYIGKARRAVLVGIDSMTLDLLERYISQGRLPNLAWLMKTGVTTETFASLPPATATNWNTVATGAHAGTHGVVAMTIHQPGGPLDQGTSGFFSYHCQAERIWEAAERAGKRTILLRYPTTWPPTVGQGVQVEGFSDPDWNCLALAPRTVYSTRSLFRVPDGAKTVTSAPPRALPIAVKVDLQPAAGWRKMPSSSRAPLETPLPVPLTDGTGPTWWALVCATHNGGYDQVRLAKSKTELEPIADLGVGDWSPWIQHDFGRTGESTEGWLRFKLVDLAPTGEDLFLFQTQIFPTTGWTVPNGMASELVHRSGPFQELGGIGFLLWWQWMTPQDAAPLFLDELTYQAGWLGNVARHLMSTEEWDLFFTQWHGIDHMDHAFLDYLDPGHPLHSLGSHVIEQTYELADQFVGAVREALDDETVIVVTSDHGHTPRFGPWLDMNAVLEDAGLLTYLPADQQKIELDTGGYGPPVMKEIDWSRTKAATMHDGFIYVNLKGREPHGIVEPEDYDTVVEEIVDLVEDARSPAFPDKRYAEVVLRKEDAEVFGLHGDLIGDVVYFAKTRYKGSHHGNFHTSRAKIGSMRAVTIFGGPGIKQGIEREGTIHLIDIAPTMAALLDLPTPAQSEGRILWDIMK